MSHGYQLTIPWVGVVVRGSSESLEGIWLLYAVVGLDEFEDLLLHVVIAVNHFDTVRAELLHGYSLVQFSLRVIPDLLIESVVYDQRADGTGRPQTTIHKDPSALTLG